MAGTAEGNFNCACVQELISEHRNRQSFTRLYPPNNYMLSRPAVKSLRSFTENDELMSLWIQEKCRTDPSWC